MFKMFGLEEPPSSSQPESHGPLCRKGTLREVQSTDVGIIMHVGLRLCVFAENDAHTINVTDDLLQSVGLDPLEIAREGDELTVAVALSNHCNEVHIL